MRNGSRIGWRNGFRTAVLAVAATALAVGGCSSGGTEPAAGGVSGLTVTPTAPSLAVGSTLQLSAVAVDGDGAEVAGQRPVWASADSTVAAVSAEGVVTARKLGAVQIQAVVEGRSAYAFVTVVARPIAAVAVTPATASVAAGATVQLQATVSDDRGAPVAGPAVVWRSSDDAVARVTSTGLVSGVVPGTATISATAGEGRTGSARVTVSGTVAAGSGTGGGAVVARVAVQPSPAASVYVGDQLELTATPFDGSGSVVAGRTVSWSSANEAAATVDAATGRVRGVAPGTATVTATVDGQSASTVVTVSRKPVASVDITAPPELAVGQQAQLAATPRDADRQVVAGRTVVWGSSNDAVVTVGRGSGLAEARGAGSAVITATVEGDGVSSTTTIIVRAPAPPQNRAPTVDFLFGCTNLICAFTDATTDPDGSPTTWNWEFGDGVSSPYRNSDNVYQAAGTYTVKLTVTDDKGAAASVTKTVTAVTNAPRVRLVNRATGRCLSVAPGGATDPRGAQIVSRACDGRADQVYSVPVGAGVGPLQLPLYTNRYVEQPDVQPRLAQGWQWNGAQYQRWSYSAAGQLRNYVGDPCVTVRGAGEPVVGESCNGSDAQRWDAVAVTP